MPALDSLPFGLRVEVLCPKCGERSAFPETKRGETANCRKCNTLFRIPLRRPAESAAKK